MIIEYQHQILIIYHSRLICIYQINIYVMVNLLNLRFSLVLYTNLPKRVPVLTNERYKISM